MITQAMLRELMQLRKEATAATDRSNKLRDRIKAMYKQRIAVEGGPLTVTIHVQERNVLTWADVRRVLGPVVVAELQAACEPKETEYLLVNDVNNPRPRRTPKPDRTGNPESPAQPEDLADDTGAQIPF